MNVPQTAKVLGTGARFIRRLVAERRIRFHRVGSHVRIELSDLESFVAAGTVEATRPPLRL